MEIIWIEEKNEKSAIRQWPTGFLLNGKQKIPKVLVHCITEYVPWKAMCVDHKPLKISIYDYSNEKPLLRTINREFESMLDIRIWCNEFFEKKLNN
jgi:hypothetical protein